MTKRIPVSFALALLLGMGWLPAQTARFFSAAQTSPTPAPGQFDMSTTQSVTMSLTNNNTGGNASERIYEIRFRLTTGCTAPCTLTTFSSSTAAPAGWTRTAFSTSSITFQATSWNNAIATVASGGPTTSVAFTFLLTTGTFTLDTSQTFQDMRSRWTTSAAGPPFSRSGQVTCSSAGTCGSVGSWKAMSLSIIGFQTTDLSNNPVSAIAAGAGFKLVITVKNISTASQSSIVSVASPPAFPPSLKTGTVTLNNPAPVNSPNPLTLAAGAQGTITYTYTTSGSDSGTVTFTVANVRNSANTATSRSGTSNTLSVSPLTVSIAITASAAPAACLFAGGNATFTMTVANNTGGTVTGVSPTLNAPTVANGANVGAYSAPTTNPVGCNASLANGSSCAFKWTATTSVTGSYPSGPPQPSFFTTGFASATSGGSTITSPVNPSNTENILEYVVSVSPVAISASSTNVELDWNVANLGCPSAFVSSVAVTVVPAGWTLSPDPTYAYSLVTDTTGSANDTWTVSGTTFTAPNASSQIPANRLDNDFYLLFSATPSTLGTSTFTVVVTDTNGVSRTQTTPVTVNALTPGSVTPWTWREIFQ